MQTAKKTLAIVALTTTLVSCRSPQAPATVSMIPDEILQVSATTAVYPLAVDIVREYGNYSGSTSATIRTGNYEALMANLVPGGSTLLMTNYLASESPFWAAPIAQDGIAVITHPENSLDNLTISELRAIYQGRINTWGELGGGDHEILVVSREDGSGTRAAFDRMVMGSRVTIADALVASSTEQMLERIASTPGSIGYLSVAQIDERVKVLALDGVLPEPGLVAANIYALRTTIYIVSAEEPGSAGLDFVRWLQGPAGQDVVSRRYVPFIVSSLPES